MMQRSILASLFVLFSLSAGALGCSRASVVCDLICTCEHCNDQDEVEACNQLETAEEVASAYGCAEKWEAYTVCIETRGQCDETEARFSTENDAGEDRCQDARDSLAECIDDASAHEGVNNNF